MVSKVYPHNASRIGVRTACERSRRRLGLDCIDLFPLHWRGSHPLAGNAGRLRGAAGAGHIARWGVSNFDLDDMEELDGVRGGSACAANQVYYSLGQRGAGHALRPGCSARPALMAYCPIDQGVLAANARLAELAARKGGERGQLALAWAMQQGGVMAIPKAVREAHLRENSRRRRSRSRPRISALDDLPRRRAARRRWRWKKRPRGVVL